MPDTSTAMISRLDSTTSAVSSHDDRALTHPRFSSTLDDRSPQIFEVPTWDTFPINNLSQASGEPLPSKYDLRVTARNSVKAVLCTWIDQDATTTYDPKSKYDPGLLDAPAEHSLRRKRERPQRSDENLDNATKVPKTTTWQRGRLEGKRLAVTLRLTSARGKAALEAYGASLDNWPDSALRPEQDDSSWVSWWNSGCEPFTDSVSLTSTNYGLRKRTRLGSPDLTNLDDSESCSIADLTVGHPAARGCKACFALRHRCPLLNEGVKYPCNLCTEDDIDCELIIQPERKRVCEHCSRKRIVCSYREDGSDHKSPCRNCNNKGINCIAGPASGRTRTGPSLDSPYPGLVAAPQKRTFASCTQCRQAKKWCSLTGKRKEVPCGCCRKNNQLCTFEPLKIVPTKPQQIKETQPEGPKPIAVSSAKTAKVITGSTQVITTKLAHPIAFNYQCDEKESTPCHWCDDAVYGLLGLGEVSVTVVDHDDGLGFIEMSGGHTNAGYPASRMCAMCTLGRIMITACRVHEIEAIDDMDPESFDYDSITDWMMPGMAACAPFAWCAVCPAPAFFACGKDHDPEVGEMDCEGFGRNKGCGLTLCESCAEALVNEHDGNLEVLIDSMKKMNGEGGFGLRADVDLLHSNGELLRRIDTE